MIFKTALAVIAALLFMLGHEIGSDQSSELTVNKLMPGCRLFLIMREKTDFFEQGYCAGFLIAAVDSDPTICRPEPVTNEQVVLLVVQYVEQRPDRQHEQFLNLATEVL